MDNPALFVRVSLPAGHFTVPAATAERAGLKPLKRHDAVDAKGRPRPPKLREDFLAVTPESEPETSVSADTEEK